VTRVKICGITDARDAALCAAAGADALGFVVEYPLPVPWSIDRTTAAALMRSLPPFVTRVAVVGGDAATVLELVEATAPDVVQLHLDESEATVGAVRAGLEGTGTRIVKAIRISADPAESPPPAAEVVERARRFLAAGADAILLDSKTGRRPAGTGAAIERSLARAVAADLEAPLILAGGLTPENVAAAILEVRPAAVDVISSLEDESHRKRPERVDAFLAAARAA
jgi:phosphoribosylanthranilate isomerase